MKRIYCYQSNDGYFPIAVVYSSVFKKCDPFCPFMVAFSVEDWPWNKLVPVITYTAAATDSHFLIFPSELTTKIKAA